MHALHCTSFQVECSHLSLTSFLPFCLLLEASKPSFPQEQEQQQQEQEQEQEQQEMSSGMALGYRRGKNHSSTSRTSMHGPHGCLNKIIFLIVQFLS